MSSPIGHTLSCNRSKVFPSEGNQKVISLSPLFQSPRLDSGFFSSYLHASFRKPAPSGPPQSRRIPGIILLLCAYPSDFHNFPLVKAVNPSRWLLPRDLLNNSPLSTVSDPPFCLWHLSFKLFQRRIPQILQPQGGLRSGPQIQSLRSLLLLLVQLNVESFRFKGRSDHLEIDTVSPL